MDATTKKELLEPIAKIASEWLNEAQQMKKWERHTPAHNLWVKLHENHSKQILKLLATHNIIKLDDNESKIAKFCRECF